MSQVLERVTPYKEKGLIPKGIDEASFLLRCADLWSQRWIFPLSKDLSVGIFRLSPEYSVGSQRRQFDEGLRRLPKNSTASKGLVDDRQTFNDFVTANDIPETGRVIRLHVPPRPKEDISRTLYTHTVASMARVVEWLSAYLFFQNDNGADSLVMGWSQFITPKIAKKLGFDLSTVSNMTPWENKLKGLIERVAVINKRKLDSIKALIKKPVFLVMATTKSLQDKYGVSKTEHGLIVADTQITMPTFDNDWTMIIGRNHVGFNIAGTGKSDKLLGDPRRLVSEVIWGAIWVSWSAAHHEGRDLRIALEFPKVLSPIFPPANFGENKYYRDDDLRADYVLHYLGLPIDSYVAPTPEFIDQIVLAVRNLGNRGL